jgi:hypothetical protein
VDPRGGLLSFEEESLHLTLLEIESQLWIWELNAKSGFSRLQPANYTIDLFQLPIITGVTENKVKFTGNSSEN